MKRRLRATVAIMTAWAAVWSVAGVGFGALAMTDTHRPAPGVALPLLAGLFAICGAVCAALFSAMLARSSAKAVSGLRTPRVAALGAVASGGLAAAFILALVLAGVPDNVLGPLQFILVAGALGALTAAAMLALAQREGRPDEDGAPAT